MIIFFDDVMDINNDVMTFILRRPRVANFLQSSNLEPCLLKQPLKTQTKLRN